MAGKAPGIRRASGCVSSGACNLLACRAAILFRHAGLSSPVWTVAISAYQAAAPVKLSPGGDEISPSTLFGL